MAKIFKIPDFTHPAAKGVRQKDFDHFFFCFWDSFGHFSVTFSDASVTFFVTVSPELLLRQRDLQ